jgi:hypothetical protein
MLIITPTKLKEMENSIFRTQKIPYQQESPENYEFRASTGRIFKNYKTHDNGIPRGRRYSVNDIIQFSVFKGYTIKRIIEEDFDYFLWFARKIENFSYDEKVLEYAKNILNTLINLDHPKIETLPKLKYAHDQVSIMLQYEHELDYGEDPFLRDAYKSMVNIKFYKTIYGKPIEKIIRQSLTHFTYSNEYRIQYLEEISNKH